LEHALTRAGILTKEAVFYNRFGQLIYSEPLGRYAGNAYPQFSIHRGDLQTVLLDAFTARAGADRIHAGWKCTRFEQDGTGATAHFRSTSTGEALPSQR